MQMDDESLVEALYKSLIKRRYLNVVDDIWDMNSWNDFGRYFPDDKNGSRILFTTRHKEVGLKASHHSVVNELHILSDVECWELLQRKVFQKEHCPQELVDIGKQIAKNCQGLPLAVVVIGAVLEKIEMKEHLWHKVATSLSSVISEDPNKFNDILELSYKHLPMHLKPCFLYFGAFKEDEEMSVKELTRRWVGEGFIKKEEGKNSEDVAYEYLVDLIDRSLIQVAKRTSLGRVKTCNIHDLLYDMCLRIGEEQNFLKEVKRKLTLVRVFMSREGAKIIGRLPNLVVLKLQKCSFEGNQWNTTEGEFQQLKVLKLSSVHDTEWNASCDPFPRLEQLVLKYCNLEKITSRFGDIPMLQMIEVHYCNQSVVESAMQIQAEQQDLGNEELQVIISSYT